MSVPVIVSGIMLARCSYVNITGICFTLSISLFPFSKHTCRFLFKGDGRAVPISTQQQNMHADQHNNRVSFDSGVHTSCPKGSASSLHRSPSISTPQRQQSIHSQGSDSGLPPSFPPKRASASSYQSPNISRQMSTESHGSETSSPYSQQPPPVHLNSHPSRRHSLRSTSTSINYENVDTDSGISSYNSASSRRSSTMSEMTDGDQFQLETEDENNGPFRSDSADGIVGRHTTFSTHRSTSHYQVPPIRSHTVSSPRPYLHSGDYEKMINPRSNSLSHITPEEQYVQMRPAPPNKTNSFRSLSDSPPKQLRPITEGRVQQQHDDEPSNYENVAFQSNVKQSDFQYYAPQYENMEEFQRTRSIGQSSKCVNGVSPGNTHTIETHSPPVIIPTP